MDIKSNHEILKELDRVVIGHNHTKMALINAVNRSKIRFLLKYIVGDEDAEKLVNDNILLIGGSGSGKTYILDCLSKIMHFPFVVISATDLTLTGASSDGIKPKNLEAMIMTACDTFKFNNPELEIYMYDTTTIVEQCVVFVDEIDKLAKPHDSSGGWSKQVQSTFLKMFDNNTKFKDVIFVFAGAFDGIEEEKGSNKNAVGFHGDSTSKDEQEVNDEDVIKYGLLPELVGRCGRILTLQTLTKNHYEQILNNLILPDKNEEFNVLGIPDLVLTSDQEDKIINKTVKSGQGVRALKREINKIALQYEFNSGAMNSDNIISGLLSVLEDIDSPGVSPKDDEEGGS